MPYLYGSPYYSSYAYPYSYGAYSYPYSYGYSYPYSYGYGYGADLGGIERELVGALRSAADAVLGPAPRAARLGWKADHADEIKAMSAARRALIARPGLTDEQRRTEMRELPSQQQRELRRLMAEWWERRLETLYARGVPSKAALEDLEKEATLGGSRACKGGGELLAKDGTPLCGHEARLARWRQHFAELFDRESAADLAYSSRAAPARDVAADIDHAPTRKEYYEAVAALKSNKAAGEDGVVAELLRAGGEQFHDHFYDLVGAEPFPVNTGVRQGCLIAPTLLNLFYAAVLDDWRRGADADIKLHLTPGAKDLRAAGRRGCKTRATRVDDVIYADDTTILASSWHTAQRKWYRHVDVVGRFGLTIAYPKTKVLAAGFDDTGGDRLAADPARQHEIGPWLRLEHVPDFNLLGSSVQDDGGYTQEASARLRAAGAAWARLLPTCFRCKQVPRRLKYRAFAGFVQTHLLYGAETWMMPAGQLARLQKFYNRCLRGVAGYNLLTMADKHVTDADIRRMLGAPQLRELVDRGCLRWFGHVARMSAGRLPLQLLTADVGGWPVDRGATSHAAGHKNWYRFSHRVLQALRHFGIDSSVAMEAAQDATRWRRRIHAPGWTLDPRPGAAAGGWPTPADLPHARQRPEKEPLHCPGCGYQTPFLSWMEAHLSRHHPGEEHADPERDRCLEHVRRLEAARAHHRRKRRRKRDGEEPADGTHAKVGRGPPSAAAAAASAAPGTQQHGIAAACPHPMGEGGGAAELKPMPPRERRRRPPQGASPAPVPSDSDSPPPAPIPRGRAAARARALRYTGRTEEATSAPPPEDPHLPPMWAGWDYAYPYSYGAYSYPYSYGYSYQYSYGYGYGY
eukprot:gene815-101_t